MSQPLRFILLHPKAMPDDSIAQWEAWLKSQVPPDVEVKTGRDDFMETAKHNGGWVTWARSVAERYDGGIITSSDGTVGRVTAQVVELFLAWNKSVAVVNARGEHSPVRAITKTTGKMQDGWVVS